MPEPQPGMAVLVGQSIAQVPAAFQPGDRLLALHTTGELLVVPRAVHELAAATVAQARAAFYELAALPDEAITAFYAACAARLRDDAVWAQIAHANAEDVAAARAEGRATTRLRVSDKMRRDMIEGLAAWQALPARRNLVVETTRHEGWVMEHVVDGLGVVGFVFEGRPNVFADATGVLRGGNTAVLRIGSAALATARAIDALALRPALAQAGLPAGAVVLLDSKERAAGWALFAQPDLALAVARGSGPAVAQLGAIARQAGIPVSLHGTGGAWLIADGTADDARLQAAFYHSLDRKVCNTVNAVCVLRQCAARLIPLLVAVLERRGAEEVDGVAPGYKLHITPAAQPFVPADLLTQPRRIMRAEGPAEEPAAALIAGDCLGHEWEWDVAPELTLTVVDDLDEAVALFNQHSPHFIVSLLSADPAAHERVWRACDAPFAGDGFTRWVDGQFALDRPELGLSNWQHGRLFARGAILSGDGVYTLRYRARQSDPELHR